MINIKQKDIDRFWAKVDKEKSAIFYNGTRCWEWTASCSSKGYGQIGLNSKMLRTNRVAYEITFEEIPEGLWVLHHCDNPPCCNPAHLFLGTNYDNQSDKMRKGRQGAARGEANGTHKLSDAQVAEIRRRYQRNVRGGENSVALAKEFGVSSMQISHIVRYKSRA